MSNPTVLSCIRHGLVKFNMCNGPKGVRYRCSACQVEAVSKRRKALKALAVHYLGGECEDCGYNKSISAMEFHHRDPSQKDFSIAGSGVTRSFESMKVELDKCKLLCANCHREEHARLQELVDDNRIAGFVESLFQQWAV